MNDMRKLHLSNLALRIFWVILAIYCMLIIWAFLPVQGSAIKQALAVAFLPAVGVLCALGFAELWMVLKAGLRANPLNNFLFMVAVATIATPVAIMLHNLVSYLAGIWFGAPEEGFFFILGLIVSPLLFVVGCCGVLWNLASGRIAGVHSGR